MNVDKLFRDGSFTMEGTNGMTAQYRWIKLPPIKEGYEVVRVQEVEDLLGGPVGGKDLLMTDAMVHMGGLILVKEKETEPDRGIE